MKKLYLFIISISLLLSCDPMSMSKIFLANNSSYDLKIAMNIYERGKEDIIVRKGEIKEITRIVILGTRSPLPGRHVRSFKIYNADTGRLLKSMDNQKIFSEFEVDKGFL